MTSNVQNFGARGDGKTDDTKAFLDAAAAVPASGGILHIPAGIYQLHRSITVKDRAIVVRGDGIGVSRLWWASTAPSVGINIVQSRGQTIQTDFTHVHGLSLYTHTSNAGTALVVDLSGQVDPQAGGVVMNRTNPRICIEQLDIRGEDSSSQGWQTAILLNHGHHAVVNNVHIVGMTSGGVAKTGIHLDGMGKPTEVQISQTWVFHVNKALHITGRPEGVKLSQCDFIAVEYGIFAERCLQMNVVYTHIDASHGCILARNVDQSSFSNCLIYKCLDTCEGFGIQIEGGSGRNIIANCVFFNTAPKADMHAVMLAGNSHHCIVANNIFQNHGTGVMCLPGAIKCQASGNVFEYPTLLKCMWQQGDPSNRCIDMLSIPGPPASNPAGASSGPMHTTGKLKGLFRSYLAKQALDYLHSCQVFPLQCGRHVRSGRAEDSHSLWHAARQPPRRKQGRRHPSVFAGGTMRRCQL